MKSERLVVFGVVQGVGYRQWLKRHAEKAGLSGWARNRADGTVEALVSGEETAVEGLIRLAMTGPLHAKVDRIDRTPEASPVDGGFAILPDA